MIRKELKRFVAAQLAGIVIATGMGTTSVIAATDGNTSDTSFEIDGPYVWGEFGNKKSRTKKNTTPIYIKVKSVPTNGQQIYVRNSNGDLVTGVANAYVGQEYFFKFKNTRIMSVAPYSRFEGNVGTVTGVWSPDSIGAHNVIK